MSDIELTFDASRFDVKAIHAFLSETYWSPGVPITIVEKAIVGSLCIGALSEGTQIGFARLVTDRATFAYLADVFVLPEYRGKGVSKQMLERLFAHPDVQGLRRMMLATRDAHDLYKKFGFAPLAAPARFMELHNPNAYTAKPPSAA
jgi:N-acetylglutamate synthase-like GNAT family acetyltransferase